MFRGALLSVAVAATAGFAPAAALAAGSKSGATSNGSGTSTATTSTAPAASAPAAVPGQSGNPFSPGVPLSPSQIPTTTAPPVQISTTPTSGSSGLSGGTAIGIAIGAFAVLTGIALFIWRDARRRAPVRQRAAAATAGAGGRTGTKPKPKSRKPSPAERRRRKRGRAR